MKRFVLALVASPLVFALGLLTSGCTIVQVDQPPEAVVGSDVDIRVLCFNPFQPGNENNLNERFVLCVMVPSDWTYSSGTYNVFLDDFTGLGSGVGLEVPNAQIPFNWGDSAAAYVPPPAGMKWIGLAADRGHTYNDSIYVEALMTFKAGTTVGDFQLGYLMSYNDAGSFGDFTNGYTDTAMGYLITVVATQDVERLDNSVPATYSLAQNYPNPFNPTTEIAFSVPKSGHVRLDVCSMSGQIVATLVDEDLGAGTFRVTWDGHDAAGRALSSGVYLYRIRAGEFSVTKKMVLLK